MSGTSFCQRCYNNFVASVARKTAGGLRAYVDPRDMTFMCKVPQYTHDNQGNPMVAILDCDTGVVMRLPEAEYRRRRVAGEL